MNPQNGPKWTLSDIAQIFQSCGCLLVLIPVALFFLAIFWAAIRS